MIFGFFGSTARAETSPPRGPCDGPQTPTPANAPPAAPTHVLDTSPIRRRHARSRKRPRPRDIPCDSTGQGADEEPPARKPYAKEKRPPLRAASLVPGMNRRQGFDTTIDFVPPKASLPPTLSTVNVTEPTRLAISAFETVHWPLPSVVHEALPDVPFDHVPDTTTPDAGEPFEVTVVVTLAVQVEPLFALEPVSETFVPVADAVGVADAWFELADSLLEVSTARTT